MTFGPASTLNDVVVPVATEADAAATAAALLGHVSNGSRVVAVHVVEKAGGAPDKASVEQREQDAEAIFDRFADELDGGLADVNLETRILYGTDVAAAIIDAAHDEDASAIVFTPRGGSKWVKLLTGDVASEIVNESDVPVIVLPDEDDEGGDGT